LASIWAAVVTTDATDLLGVMLFCPTCANLLVISAETGYNKWACNTCAYEFPISKQVCHASFEILCFYLFRRTVLQMTSRTRLKRKEVDDVLGGDEMWKHADSTAGELCSNLLLGPADVYFIYFAR
jgi:hypothetical protein